MGYYFFSSSISIHTSFRTRGDTADDIYIVDIRIRLEESKHHKHTRNDKGKHRKWIDCDHLISSVRDKHELGKQVDAHYSDDKTYIDGRIYFIYRWEKWIQGWEELYDHIEGDHIKHTSFPCGSFCWDIFHSWFFEVYIVLLYSCMSIWLLINLRLN